MGIITELNEFIAACESAYETDMYASEALARVAGMQFTSKVNEYDLQFMKENCDEYDCVADDMILEEANESFINKIKAAAATAKEAIIKFFRDLIDKVKEFHKNISEKLSSLKLKNPLIRMKKAKCVRAQAAKDVKKAYDKLEKKLSTMSLRVAAGDEVAIGELDDLYDDFMREVDTALDETDRTVDEILKLSKAGVDECNKLLDAIKDSSIKAMDHVDNHSDRVGSVEGTSALSRIIAIISRAAQKAGQALASIPAKISAAIGRALGKKTGSEGDGSQTNESVEDGYYESTSDVVADIFSLDMDSLI